MSHAQQQEVMRLCRGRKARVEAARRKALEEPNPSSQNNRAGILKPAPLLSLLTPPFVPPAPAR